MRSDKPASLIALLLVMAAMLCSAPAGAQTSGAAPTATGKWKGTRTVTGQTGGPEEFKVHSISFELAQSGTKVTGSYRCYAGKKANIDCNNPVGNITDGKMTKDGIMMQVQAMPNDLQCTFTGLVEAAKMHGRYSCYAGGSFATTGVWEVHRAE
ncbi:MAG TPA: hypothetical protein VMB26_10175 [Candidatus Binataceae bacterium]|nr:hypothetical protein [Candidatus Binataceae bacterium]